MKRLYAAAMVTALLALFIFTAAAARAETYPLWPPEAGTKSLRLLSPKVVEATYIGAGLSDEHWDLMNPESGPGLPWPGDFEVRVDNLLINVVSVGFKRRALYATLDKKDIRLGNHLYLRLDRAVVPGARVEVANLSGTLWPKGAPLSVSADPNRFSPAIHVSQFGYGANWPKMAVYGYWLGSLGELDSPAERIFEVVNTATGLVAFSGPLERRLDSGFSDMPYLKVFAADFSRFTQVGTYRIRIPGFGASYPFEIGPNAPTALARAYALGFYHQRSGAGIGQPYTRHAHAPSHTAAAYVPDGGFETAQAMIRGNSKDNPSAPRMISSAASLFPYVRQGRVDVSGGHHDAGDYSKYTINSAQLIHALAFALDAMPGVANLDNLGLPESGDGVPDIAQLVKWEADFLAKMQDDDGGFYVLVYPRERSYEIDVTPDQGDPQIVFPKNTAATAAATAALAQAAGSPHFKRHYPDTARHYLEKALAGWRFLERAWSKYGREGSFQFLHHYGAFFLDADEIAWAATELFLTTGDPVFHRFLLDNFDPTDPDTRLWTWWRLYEGYGSAVRSYAFASRTGRIAESALDADHLAGCRAEIIDTGLQKAEYSRACSYNTSFPAPSKRQRRAGWYFPLNSAFELAAAQLLEPQEEIMAALSGNVVFEGGVNPHSTCLITGLGYSSPREIVNQFSRNDRRKLPPSGMNVGGISEGFARVPAGLSPLLDAATYPPEENWPFYDRWADTFNLAGEPTVVAASQGLAVAAWLMASTPLASQPYKYIPALVSGQAGPLKAGQSYTYTLKIGQEMDMARARVVWEAAGIEPVLGQSLVYTPAKRGPAWVEAEITWPDGRRAFAVLELIVN